MSIKATALLSTANRGGDPVRDEPLRATTGAGDPGFASRGTPDRHALDTRAPAAAPVFAQSPEIASHVVPTAASYASPVEVAPDNPLDAMLGQFVSMTEPGQ
jgi:hypothetical protein